MVILTILIIFIDLWLLNGHLKWKAAEQGVKQGWKDAERYPLEVCPEHESKAYKIGWERQRIHSARKRKEWYERYTAHLKKDFEEQQARREERISQLTERMVRGEGFWKEEIKELQEFSELAKRKHAEDPIAWEMEVYSSQLDYFLEELELLCEKAKSDSEVRTALFQAILRDDFEIELPSYANWLQTVRVDIEDRIDQVTDRVELHEAYGPHVEMLQSVLQKATRKVKSL